MIQMKWTKTGSAISPILFLSARKTMGYRNYQSLVGNPNKLSIRPRSHSPGELRRRKVFSRIVRNDKT